MQESARDQHAPAIRASAAGMLTTLLYFDIFDYPLTREEILLYHPSRNAGADEDLALSDLLRQNLVYKFGQFYSVQNEPDHVRRRLAGNRLASEKLETAKKISTLISWCPYVRAVMLSGSISKGFMNEESDIDFFVVTAPDRLWIARTLLALFKRLVLFNSHKHFCTNYFVDSNHLEIEEKNMFTAMESVTLIPVYGGRLYREFLTANEWALQHFPNAAPRDTNTLEDDGPVVRRFCEALLGNDLATRINEHLMRVAGRRWKRLFQTQYAPDDFDIAFKTRPYTSKNHPKAYQKRVLEALQERVAKFEAEHDLALNEDLQ